MVQALDLDLMRDSKTPQDVEIRFEARKPVSDPTLGIAVNISKVGTPQHRLVTIGDSLTHGFQSGAIFNTQLSYPAIIAKYLGWSELRYPKYDTSPNGGLPLNLENLANNLQKRFGNQINWLNAIPVIWFIRNHLDVIENYWERGAGAVSSSHGKIFHNLAIYGWDLRNTLSRNADICLEVINKEKPKDDLLRQIVENHNDRAAVTVLSTALYDNGKALTPLQAAAALGAEGNETEGIETLVVMIGANNALGTILTFNVSWSGDGYDDMNVNDKYTVWRPIHFKAELDLLVAEIKKIRARHVILATVPHITIAPLARGVGGKVRERSRYFPYYTLPWIGDKDFNPNKHPRITENEARAIDSAIDQYNGAITEVVRQARTEGRDWYLFELCGLLDRLASRRYIEDPTARPDWWNQAGGEYQLPSALRSISPPLTSELFRSDSKGRTQGGLFSLDGIHPSTVGYGIMAQEVIKVMQLAGVKFYESDGKTEREGEIEVNFQDLIARDTLISQTPRNVDSILDFVGGIDKNFNLISGMMKRNY